jgi:multiple sugar transport system substrate-binding protein
MHNLKHPAPVAFGGGIDRRSFLRLSAGAGVGLALAACGPGSSNAPGASGEQQQSQTGTGDTYDGPAVELAFWNGFTGADGPVMQDLVKQFSSEHDNIAVKMSTQEWADYYQKVPNAVSSGRGPDVGIMHIDQLATNAARNVIQPLDEVAEGLGLDPANFPDAVWNAGVYNDQRFGIPLDIHPLGLYYNKKLMQQAGLDPESPPQDMDSYMQALEALKGEGIQGHWMSPFPFTGVLQFQALIRQFGGDLFNTDATQATYNEGPGVEALTWMVDLVKEGYSPRDVGQDADHVAFQNDKNAFIWNGIWQIAAYRDTDGLEWGVAELPAIGGEQAAWAGSHNFVLMQQRRPEPNKLQAGAVFIKWINEHSLEWAKGGQVPANQMVRDMPEFQELEEQSTFAKELDYVHFPPALPGIGDAMATMDTAVNEAVLLQKEPQQALDDAAATADKLLEENAKKYGA